MKSIERRQIPAAPADSQRPWQKAHALSAARYRCWLLASAATGVLALALVQPACAADETWTGAVSSDWFDPANWSGGTPGAGDNVTINTSTPHPTTINGNTAILGNVTVSNSGNLSLVSGSYTNTGVFTVSSGGTVNGGTVGTTIDGGTIASHDLLIVTGAGSTYTDGGPLTIGKTAVGELTLADGGKYSAPSVTIAYQAGSFGYLNIGAGVAHSGPADAAVAPGTLDTASITFGAGSGFLTFNHTSNNYVFAPAISGNGEISVFAGTTRLNANSSGFSGTVSMSGGELDVAGQLGFVNSHFSAGTLRVTGTMTGVGGFGDVNVEGGTVIIENGGSVTGRDGSISNGGTAIVSGAGSHWTSNFITVGQGSSGTFVVKDGGRVDSVTARIGDETAAGTATVSGAGSQWNISNRFLVGSTAGGTLTIANGGVVSGQSVSIGFNDSLVPAGSTESGRVTVTGAGSLLSLSGIIYLGADAGDTAAPGTEIRSGALTVADGGKVSGPSIQIATQSNASGSLNIGAGLGQSAVAPGTVDTPSVVLAAGSSQIVFNHTAQDYSFAPVISGAGEVHVLAGRTILTGANTYTGPTTIDGGTLQVDGSIASSSLTSVNNGGVLAGAGTVGVTQINSGGAFAPGNFTPGSDDRLR
jgi:T5SS/PEP-CTERM-associated repeat protein/autotransporter-associated beta strand protein